MRVYVIGGLRLRTYLIVKTEMISMKQTAILLALVIGFNAAPAYAYIGPGLGLGVAATIVGIVIAFLLLIVGLIWMPLRRVIRTWKARSSSTRSER